VSQENVDLWRNTVNASARGDWDAWEVHIDPDIFVRLDRNWPEQRICGRDAFQNFLRSTQETLGSSRRAEEVMDLGDRVLARHVWNTRGQFSGIQGDLRWSEIVTLRDGRCVFAELYLDHADALKALGLEE
jgi:ketosteroid isomerase-like protein